jgi:hypothetical protein
MVLVSLSRRADLRLRELAAEAGISPRAVQTIVSDLVRDGFLERSRVGRRNHYRVVGNRPLPDRWAEDRRLGDLVRTLARMESTPRVSGGRDVLVLACSDHRYQPSLRRLLGSIGMDVGAEIVLWPGGSAALTEPGGTVLLELIALTFEADPPQRVVLVAHERCHGSSQPPPGTRDPLEVVAEASRRRRRTVELIRETFGIRPELWYQTQHGARRMGGAGPRSRNETTRQTKVEAMAGEGR